MSKRIVTYLVLLSLSLGIGCHSGFTEPVSIPLENCYLRVLPSYGFKHGRWDIYKFYEDKLEVTRIDHTRVVPDTLKTTSTISWDDYEFTVHCDFAGDFYISTPFTPHEVILTNRKDVFGIRTEKCGTYLLEKVPCSCQ